MPQVIALPIYTPVTSLQDITFETLLLPDVSDPAELWSDTDTLYDRDAQGRFVPFAGSPIYGELLKETVKRQYEERWKDEERWEDEE